MAARFYLTDPHNFTLQQRLDKIAAFCATGARRVLAAMRNRRHPRLLACSARPS